MPVSPESSSSDLTVERDAALARLAALPQAVHLPPETRRQWLDHQLERAQTGIREWAPRIAHAAPATSCRRLTSLQQVRDLQRQAHR